MQLPPWGPVPSGLGAHRHNREARGGSASPTSSHPRPRLFSAPSTPRSRRGARRTAVISRPGSPEPQIAVGVCRLVFQQRHTSHHHRWLLPAGNGARPRGQVSQHAVLRPRHEPSGQEGSGERRVEQLSRSTGSSAPAPRPRRPRACAIHWLDCWPRRSGEGAFPPRETALEETHWVFRDPGCGNRGPGGRAGAEIWGKAGPPGQHVS